MLINTLLYVVAVLSGVYLNHQLPLKDAIQKGLGIIEHQAFRLLPRRIEYVTKEVEVVKVC